MQNHEAIDDAATRDALARVLRSAAFSLSDRLQRFLTFVVERAIDGTADQLKEALIGEAVYDRKPPYDPSQDSIVRSEARRLRAKLKEYYETEGRNDPVVISIRSGRYIPQFQQASEAQLGEAKKEANGGLYQEGSGVCLAVLPFVDASNHSLSAACARDLTEELIHKLVQTEGCRVASSSSVAQLSAPGVDIPSLARKLGVQILFEGTVRAEENHLRTTARISNSDGFQLWTQRFDVECGPQDLFLVAERIASSLISGIRPELIGIRKNRATVSDAILAVQPALWRAEAQMDKGTAADLRTAQARFEEISKTVPTYARPLCNIAQCHYETALSGIADSASHVAKAREAAVRAMALDSQLTASHVCLASALALELNWRDAEAGFHHALSLGNQVTTYRQFALFLSAAQRFDEAWHYLQEAQQIDPFSVRQKIACAKFFHLSRRWDEGLAHFQSRPIFGPLPVETRLYVALMQIQSGQSDEGGKATLAAQREAGGQPTLMSRIAENLALSGDLAAATRIVEDFKLPSPNSPLSRFRQALLALSLGQRDRGLSDLVQAVAEKEAECVWLAAEPRLDALRTEPEFEKLLVEVQAGFGS